MEVWKKCEYRLQTRGSSISETKATKKIEKEVLVNHEKKFLNPFGRI